MVKPIIKVMRLLLSMKLFNKHGTGKKFNKAYMLARELGSGAFSIVKLGVNKVVH